MKTKIGILVLALCTTFYSVQAQRRVVTTTRATSYDISDNLDLDAVASIFGDSENLEDFEHRLNNPDNRISNLDLNEDGYIDYLRVVENSSDRNSLVVIQAVLDRDVYQDVATIEIERVHNGNPRIQIVGDSYIYGTNYIIEPVFFRTPLIFSFFWSPRYSMWQSPYYWNYYPKWYRHYRPYSPFKYHRQVYVHINTRNTYHHADNRFFNFSGDNHKHLRRSDYASRYPNKAFNNRHEGLKNKQELYERRSNNSVNRPRNNDVQRPNNRKYEDNRNSVPGRSERQRNVYENKRLKMDDKSRSNQTPSKERSNVDNNRKRSDSSNGSIQNKPVEGNKTYNKPSVTRSRSTSTPGKPVNRVEPTKRSSTPSEKSGSVSNRSRTNKEVKQKQQSATKTETPKKETKKETETRRRRSE